MSRKRASLWRWILVATVLVNLGIASRASADLNNDTCQDPETGDVYLCCTWCIFFCECELDDIPG